MCEQGMGSGLMSPRVPLFRFLGLTNEFWHDRGKNGRVSEKFTRQILLFPTNSERRYSPEIVQVQKLQLAGEITGDKFCKTPYISAYIFSIMMIRYVMSS